jgi:hypothetical protein
MILPSVLWDYGGAINASARTARFGRLLDRIVMMITEALKIVPVEEKERIAPMRDLVIDYGCLFNRPVSTAHDAYLMELEPLSPRGPPPWGLIP